jgi:HEPN domain-containing protein
MSVDKNKAEAQRWLKTASDDLDTADILKRKRKFAHSCFHAQQAGEKALKSVWYFVSADPWGHSIKKMIDDLEVIDINLYRSLLNCTREAVVLDRFYVPTRYQNGLPDITPDEAFDEEDAAACIEYAHKIIGAVKGILEFDLS